MRLTNLSLYCRMATAFAGWLHQRALTYFLREMGIVLLAGGSAHFIAVTYLYFSNGWPSHDRMGYIYFIGLIQLAAGGLNLLSNRLLQIDRKLASRSHLIVLTLITGYFLLILPAYPDFSAAFKIAPPAYLLFHWWMLYKIIAGNRSSL